MNPSRMKMLPHNATDIADAKTPEVDQTLRTVVANTAAGLRDGDTGLGYLAHVPHESRTLNDEDRKALNMHASQAHDQALDRYVKGQNSIAGSPGLRRSLVIFAMSILSVAAVWMLAELVTVLDTLGNLSPWLRYPAWTLLAIGGSFVIWTVSNVLVHYIRRRRIQQHTLAEVWRYAEFGSLKKAQDQLQQVKTSLLRFLEHYPLEGELQLRQAEEMGFDEDELQSLQQARDALLQKDRGLPAQEFAAKYQSTFQDVLDTCAERRSKVYAIRVGVKTGISPNRFVDMMIVLYYSFRMIGDISRIYNGRSDTFSSLLLFGSAFFHAYIAGEMEEVLESLADWIVKEGNSVVGRFAELAGSKLAESAANGLILWRMGRATRHLLQPLR